MDIFKDLFPDDLYHSYVIEGDPLTTPAILRKFFEDKGYVSPNSMDVLCQIYDSFSISDSPMIKEWHSESGGAESKRICIIGAKFINHDAERTLLKILEEPKNNTHFFIIIPNSQLLLDTIKSRVHIIKICNNKEDELVDFAKKLLSSTPSVRLDMVSKIIEENKDSEDSGKIRFFATGIINNLELIIYDKFKKDRNNKDTIFLLEEFRKSREYLSKPGASVKMILEHIALMI